MFRRIRGNARGCLIYEPLWIVPASLFMTYASLYMLQLGVSATAIGWISSLSLVVQIFTSLISGHLTDRMGRRWALITFDVLSWSVGTLLWAVSQNIWFFVIAAIINGFQKVPNTAWYCLLVEDSDIGDRPAIFSAIQLINMIGGLFAPLGGFLVHHYSLVTGERIMYGIAFVSMTIMFIGRHFATHDTEIGKRRMQESAGLDMRGLLQSYVKVTRTVFRDRPLLLLFGVYIAVNFQASIRGTYLSVYLAQALHFRDAQIALFPAVSSAAMLVLLLFVMPRLREQHAIRYMQVGFVLSAVANVILVLQPSLNWFWAILNTVLGAAGTMLFMPYLESSVANAIDDNERANVMSILTVLILVFISPSGVIGGLTYAMDPRIPFWIVTGAFFAGMLMLFIYRTGCTSAPPRDNLEIVPSTEIP